jgi:folate-dependent phosphoribosylglycinamide formyltransferase PurN
VLAVEHRLYPQALRLVAEGRVTTAAEPAASR